MFRNLEIGDKVKVLSFLGKTYDGKIIKIGTSIIYVDVMFTIPITMKFNKKTFIGLGKHKFYELDEVMYGEHKKFE